MLHYSTLATALWVGVTARNIYKQVTRKAKRYEELDEPPPPPRPMLRYVSYRIRTSLMHSGCVFSTLPGSASKWQQQVTTLFYIGFRSIPSLSSSAPDCTGVGQLSWQQTPLSQSYVITDIVVTPPGERVLPACECFVERLVRGKLCRL